MARAVLVPHDASPSADAMLRLACSTAGMHGSRIAVLAITRVHRAIRLADVPAYFDEPGWYALLRAEELAAQYPVEIETILKRSYDVAATIIHEARVLQADAIFLGIRQPRFRWFPPGLGGTARTVLRRAPCPVILGSLQRAAELDPLDLLAEADRVLHRAR